MRACVCVSVDMLACFATADVKQRTKEPRLIIFSERHLRLLLEGTLRLAKVIPVQQHGATSRGHVSVRLGSTAVVHVLILLASAHLGALPLAPGELQPFPPVLPRGALGIDLLSSYF